MHFTFRPAILLRDRRSGSLFNAPKHKHHATPSSLLRPIHHVQPIDGIAREVGGMGVGELGVTSSRHRTRGKDVVFGTALTVTMAALLVACGGGGGASGGGSGSNAVTDGSAVSTTLPAVQSGYTSSEADAASSSEDAEVGTTMPVVAQAAADTTVPRTTDSTALRTAVLRTLQEERQRCGFNALTSDASLDQAAASHSVYLANEIASGRKGLHTETPGTSGFTGETPTARAKTAGYSPRVVSEAFAHSTLAANDAAIASAPMPTERAVSHTEFLLSTVYHMLVLLAPRPDIGVGYAEQRGSDLFTQVTVMEIGAKSTISNSSQSDLLTYPCEGTAVARGSFTPSKETPNPLPDTGNGNVGTPLYLRAPEGSVLVLRSSSVMGPTGSNVPTTTLDSSNDPEQRLTQAQIFVIPKVELVKGVSYQVNLSGTINDKPFSRTFNFKPA